MDIDKYLNRKNQGIELVDSNDMTRRYIEKELPTTIEFTERDLVDRIEDGFNNYLILHAYSKMMVDRIIRHRQYEPFHTPDIDSINYLAQSLAASWGASFRVVKMARVYKDGSFSILIEM